MKTQRFTIKNATKIAFFIVKYKHNFREGTKSAEDSLETAGFWVILSDFAEKWPVNHINSNLYHYAGNNPVKYTDPDGRSPVYDPDGNLIGVTEDSGLQSNPLVMNTEDFSPKMSTEEAANKNLGIEGLNGECAVKNFISNFGLRL